MPESDQQVSTGRKILMFPLTRIVLGVLWLALTTGVTQLALRTLPGKESILFQLISMVLVVGVALSSYIAFVRVVERRSPSELALQRAGIEVFQGVLVGALLFCATICLLWLLGCFTISGMNEWTVLVPAFVMSVLSGVVEELLFRGILFRITEEGLGTWLALLISALVFGLLHLMNPNATLVAGLAIALEAGIMLAAAYMLSRRLWMAIGIHFAWNFTQGGIFGVAVSGNHASGLFQSHVSGPVLLSGGAFGAEASLIAVVVCTSAGVLFLWKAHRANRFMKPRWLR